MDCVVARLVKRKSDNGYLEVQDYVPLGRLYRIDLDRRSIHWMFNRPTRATFTAEMVWHIDAEQWFPLELLDWPGKAARLEEEETA